MRPIPVLNDNAVLTKTELRQALDVSEDLLEDLIRRGVIPVARLTDRTPRFIYGQVVRALARRADPADPHYTVTEPPLRVVS